MLYLGLMPPAAPACRSSVRRQPRLRGAVGAILALYDAMMRCSLLHCGCHRNATPPAVCKTRTGPCLEKRIHQKRWSRPARRALTLSLSGPFLAELDGQPLTSFRSDNARVLLAYLALRPGDLLHREYLANLLWPEASPGEARINLRQILYRLRQVLVVPEGCPPFLIHGHNTLGFNRESDLRVDVAAIHACFDTVAAHDHETAAACPACVQRLQDALALYRGDFLAGLALPSSSALDDWRLVVQERLHTRVLDALHLLADQAQATGDLQAATGYLRRVLALEPWREEDHRRLIRLLAQDGQMAAALAQYERCRAVLKAEWDAEPAPATTDAGRNHSRRPLPERAGTGSTPQSGHRGSAARAGRLAPAQGPSALWARAGVGAVGPLATR